LQYPTHRKTKIAQTNSSLGFEQQLQHTCFTLLITRTSVTIKRK